MNKFFPIKNRHTFAILLNDGDLFTYDDGKIAMGTKKHMTVLMECVPYDFSGAKIIKVSPAISHAKYKK